MLRVVLYAHEGDGKIVSKYCPRCGELKLTEDFTKRTMKGMLTSVCNGCHDYKEEPEQNNEEKGEIQ
jgi:uncharacterized protein (DUF983 family)